MSKLEEKYLKDYSIETLRDSAITSPLEENILIYDSVSSKWKNSSIPVYGKDAIEKTKVASETTTGSAFATYDTLNFNVSDVSGSNKYRLNADFLWGHNSASNDIRIRIQIDGNPVKEIRIEPKDAGNDQRYQNNLLYYEVDLSEGAHTLELQYRPATASRVSRMFESVMECWRTQ